MNNPFFFPLDRPEHNFRSEACHLYNGRRKGSKSLMKIGTFPHVIVSDDSDVLRYRQSGFIQRPERADGNIIVTGQKSPGAIRILQYSFHSFVTGLFETHGRMRIDGIIRGIHAVFLQRCYKLMVSQGIQNIVADKTDAVISFLFQIGDGLGHAGFIIYHNIAVVVCMETGYQQNHGDILRFQNRRKLIQNIIVYRTGEKDPFYIVGTKSIQCLNFFLFLVLSVGNQKKITVFLQLVFHFENDFREIITVNFGHDHADHFGIFSRQNFRRQVGDIV